MKIIHTAPFIILDGYYSQLNKKLDKAATIDILVRPCGH